MDWCLYIMKNSKSYQIYKKNVYELNRNKQKLTSGQALGHAFG